MTDRTYAYQANDPAGAARVRAFMPCVATPVVSLWSPIAVGTTTAHKHGRSRRPEVSHL